MIELEHNDLVFTFPEVHEEARLNIRFQRTLRIPDDDKTYPLPPGLGSFPLRQVDDFASGVPDKWLSRDGLHHDTQDYVVVPGQPWLDGYCVDKGHIRQFVAMPLGSGYSAEEQLTGAAEHGASRSWRTPSSPRLSSGCGRPSAVGRG